MRIINIPAYVVVMLLSFSATVSKAQSLQNIVDKALSNNHLVHSSSEEFRAEKKFVTSKYNLADPAIGINNLNRGNETEYITIQQMIRFPTKYHLEGKAQKRKAEAFKSKYNFTKLKLREDVISAYFELYSAQRTLEFTKANLQIVKDFARIAEKKYASGKSSQSDSMKAHFEITQLEIELLKLEQDEERLQALIKALLSDPNQEKLQLFNSEISQPIVDFARLSKQNALLESLIKESSPLLKAQEKMMESAQYKRSLAKWEFAPDFNIQYQERISGLPEDSKIISFNATIPLWFWKNSSEASYASAKANAEEYKYKDMTLKVVAQFQALKSKIEKSHKTLKIYKTTLIPQAEGSYRTSRSAYRAGTASFLDLLDAERSLYSVKLAYYKLLSRFARDVASAETLLGQSISNIPGMDKVEK